MKFRSEKLDEVDNTILGLLVKDSRSTLASISEEVGLSSPAIRERVNKLIENGVIKGFSTIVDYKKLGYELTAFIGLRMDDSKCCQEDVFTELEKIPEVLEAHFTNGEEDILVKVVSRDTESLVGLLAMLNAIESVNRTRTVIALTTPIERNLK